MNRIKIRYNDHCYWWIMPGETNITDVAPTLAEALDRIRRYLKEVPQ